MMMMTEPKTVLTIRPDHDLLDAMQRLKNRDGMPLGEQARRALREWLESRGEIPKLKSKKAKGGRR